MLYVGCSRATSAQGLRIDHFPAKPPKPSSKVEHEMSRLRTSSCALNPRFSRIMKDNKPLSCMSHNIRSLKKYENHINADNILLQSQLMFFQETGSKSSDTYNINNHIECCRIDSIHANGKSGSICFVKESIPNLTSNSTLIQDEKTCTHLEAIEVFIENITYIGIYSSPKFPIQKLCNFIEQVVSTQTKVVFIGDFNINFNKLPKQLVQILKQYNYKIIVDDITTDYGTSINNVISNVEIAALVYESLISDHRPILLLDKETYNEIEKSSVTVDDQIIEKVVENNLIEPNVNIINEGTPEKSTRARNNNNFDDIEFCRVDSGTVMVLETKTKSIEVCNNDNCDDIEFIHVNSCTIMVPENINSSIILLESNEDVITSKIQKIIPKTEKPKDVISSRIFGFTNNDNVSCYANSVIQVLFHCESLVHKIHNYELGPIIQQCLEEYSNNSISSNTRTIREYLDNETIMYTRVQQQDCVQFLEALMNRNRHTFDSLFGFQELYSSRCNLCSTTTTSDAPTSLILHLDIPQDRLQTLQTILSTDQNVWSSISDYRCNNCNNIGGYERKHQIILAHEYLIIQLKLFTTIFLNGQFVSNKITNLKLCGVPSTTLEIAGARYKPHAAIFHIGQNTSSGHYIAYLKQTRSNWVSANDTTIAETRWPNNSKDVYVIVLKKI